MVKKTQNWLSLGIFLFCMSSICMDNAQLQNCRTTQKTSKFKTFLKRLSTRVKSSKSKARRISLISPSQLTPQSYSNDNQVGHGNDPTAVEFCSDPFCTGGCGY